jgi:hypothetical protein
MNRIFLIVLFITFLIARVGSHYLHDPEAYINRQWKGKKFDKSKTITGILRRMTGYDVHHIHIGIFLLVLSIPLILVYGWNLINLIILAVGLSLFLDQIAPLIFDIGYNSKKAVLISIILHLITILIYFLFA